MAYTRVCPVWLLVGGAAAILLDPELALQLASGLVGALPREHARTMLALLALSALTADPAPRAFPPAASYTAHLVTTAKSRLCSECTFDGRHHFNSDSAKAFGHVAWQADGHLGRV